MIQRQIHIGQGLGLDTLGGIHHQYGPVTGRQASGYLIIKVHMPRGVNQIENVFLSVFSLINRTHRLGLDSDSPFSFQIHIVQHLRLHLPAG